MAAAWGCDVMVFVPEKSESTSHNEVIGSENMVVHYFIVCEEIFMFNLCILNMCLTVV